MENAMVLLYDLCRLCLDEPGVDNIFEPVDWSRDIRKFTGVKVKRSDQLPQTICNNCRDILNCTTVLRDIATTNNKRLKKLREGDKVSTPIRKIIITACTPSESDQNENTEEPDSSGDRSSRNRIVFEDDRPNESLRKTEKRHKKKRKLSSSNRDSEHVATKKISIRTDLFSSTETVVVTSSSSIVNTAPEKNYKVEDKPSISKSMTSSTRKSSASSSKDGISIKTEFDHVCETCSKCYSTPKKLYLHQLTHNRKFICPLDACEKKFATKNDLQKHIRSHTGEKPFKCNLCEQGFSQNVTLKAHRENVHNEIKLSQSQH